MRSAGKNDCNVWYAKAALKSMQSARSQSEYAFQNGLDKRLISLYLNTQSFINDSGRHSKKSNGRCARWPLFDDSRFCQEPPSPLATLTTNSTLSTNSSVTPSIPL